MSIFSQRSFAGGEIAPALYARVDQVKYTTGLRTCRNFFVMRHGGVSNRPGTSFVCEVKDSSKHVRLIEFVFNDSQTYVLEFGDQYMRVIKNGAQVTLTPQNISAITNANPCVVTYAGSDTYANGDEVVISGITGAIGAFLNGRNFKVANVNTGANTFSLTYMDGTAVNSTLFGSYTSGGTVAEVYTISTPYLEADLSTLKFAQSADVITLSHNNYAPRELARTGDASWTLTAITFAPSIAAPIGLSNTGAAGTTLEWVVTSIAAESFEESLQSASTGTSAAESTLSATPITISWSAASGAQEYNVYRKKNGIYGFIGIAGSTSFIDNGISPDTTDTPPQARNPFGSTDNYPATVNYYQQRLIFGNTNNDPEKAWASRSNQFHNFTVSSPLQEDDAVTFTVVGRKVNRINNFIELGRLVVLSSGAEVSINGDSAGVLSPTEINPKQYSNTGSAAIAPLIVGGNALYVQARGSVVRDLSFDIEVDGYRGNDLTIFSAHLFDQYTLLDWAYQQIPHSVIWAVRNDGILLGLTYVREHELWAWHRHDFQDGVVENVCVIPEGNEDFLYLTVAREIDGGVKRYIERMNTRQVVDVIDNIFMDSALSYDGRNTNALHSMTLSEYSGGGWLSTSTINVTSSAAFFSASDVGNGVHLTGDDGTLIRLVITEYVSTTVVRGRPQKIVPVSMQSVAILVWARAVDDVSGLWHLEGQQVSIFADRFVVANPKNPSYVVRTVLNGAVELDRPYSVIHVGLPFTSDLQTLDIDFANSETMADKQKLIGEVNTYVENSRGIWAGGEEPEDDLVGPDTGLIELKIREMEGYEDPVSLATDPVGIIINNATWNKNGRVFLRQSDPLPLAVLSIAPKGYVPVRG